MSNTLIERDIGITDGTLHVIETGAPDAPPVVFLHGWPQDATAWSDVMQHAGREVHAIAVDLPGIGGSAFTEPPTDTDGLADTIHSLIDALALRRPVLVGQDLGGMIAFAYLRRHHDLRAAVIMNTVIPGVPPWRDVLANPHVWHFAFHSIPGLPETLVRDHVRAYFDFFYDALSAHPDRISSAARDHYVRSYSEPAALSTGFDFYRALARDAELNTSTTVEVATPVLYVRGAAEGGDLDEYERGLRGAGLTSVRTGRIEDAGHFAPDEAPDAVWASISSFLRAAG